MADYKKMYYTLFRVQVKAKKILDEAEKRTEAMFNESKEPVALVDIKKDKPDNDTNDTCTQVVNMEPKKAKPRRLKKKWAIIILAVLLVGFIGACMVAKIGYNICFQRAAMPANSIYLRYTDVSPEQYPRSSIGFMSGGNRLSGHIYGKTSNKGLVVISHGLGATAESYFPETLYFVNNGWRVFTYNNTGSHTSEGESTKGISQSLLDLRAALDYISQDPNMNTLPIVLYGHSWGGYAVTAILNDGYPISAVASMAGFSTPKEALYDFAQGKTGIFGVIGFPFFWGYHNILFGENANISAIDGINKAQIPVMVIHGTQDKTLRYNVCGIISHQAQITNPYVVYVTRDAENQNEHSNLMFSQRSGLYTKQRLADWEQLNTQYNGNFPAEI